MLADKVKEKLFRKIKEHKEIIDKISQIESSTTEPIENNEEYEELCGEAIVIESEIENLMMDARHLPLLGLSKEQKLDLDSFAEGYRADGRENIKQEVQRILIRSHDEWESRLAKVKPINLTTTKISPYSRIHLLYQEAIRCYIFGAFDASSVLCRAISEQIAKEYIKTTEYKDSLHGDKKPEQKIMSISEIMEKLSVDKKTIDLFKKIQVKVDLILHEKEEITSEKEAYKTISEIQGFIENFFDEPKLKIEWV